MCVFSGDVLITAATGVLSEVEASRAGLVPTHAYAVLDMKMVKVRLFSNVCFLMPFVKLQRLFLEIYQKLQN